MVMETETEKRKKGEREGREAGGRQGPGGGGAEAKKGGESGVEADAFRGGIVLVFLARFRFF
jgi:hypothetical protein